MSQKQYDPGFKQDAVNYYHSSKKSLLATAKDLGLAESTLRGWVKSAAENDGSVNHRGSGNYASEEAKEIARLKRELQNHKDALEVLKKGYQHTERLTEPVYMAMKDFKESVEDSHEKKRRVPVSSVLLLLGVSSSGYYDWIDRKPSNQSLHKQEMKEAIATVHNESHQIYGAPKITKVLQANEHTISERTVSTYMKELGIKAIWVRPYKRTTIDPDIDLKLKNILNRRFNPTRPNAVWVTDITYIHTLAGFVYLTSVMDLYSRRIIGWHLSDNLSSEEVIKAIHKAKLARKAIHPVIIHSDRGCQYVSEEYIKATPANHYIRSYSRTGTPWDNACIESFHALIKREWLNRYVIHNIKQAHDLIFEYIDAFYNTKRIHSHCEMKSPIDYEKSNVS